MEFVWYENHQGQRICLSERPYKLLNVDELYAISREYIEDNGHLTGFKRKVITKAFELDILSTKDISWKDAIENFNSIIECDVVNTKAGKLYIGDYYMECFIHIVTPSKINLCNPYVTVKLTLVTESPVWVKSERYTFVSAATPTEGHDTKRYPHTYSYHYRPRIGQSVLYSQLSMPAHYQIIIYGPVTNPSVTIGGNVYQVSVELLANEYLVIDYSNTGTRTITVYHQDGQSEDKFGARSKQFSVFTKINPGRQPVLWSGDFAFDIILFDERSQPKWI